MKLFSKQLMSLFLGILKIHFKKELKKEEEILCLLSNLGWAWNAPVQGLLRAKSENFLIWMNNNACKT